MRETTQPQPPSLELRAVWGLLSIAVGIAVFFALLKITTPMLEKVAENQSIVWQAGGAPVPDEFMYVMFPISPAVEVRDSPDGNKAGMLDRAMANTQKEINSEGWIQLAEKDGGG